MDDCILTTLAEEIENELARLDDSEYIASGLDALKPSAGYIVAEASTHIRCLRLSMLELQRKFVDAASKCECGNKKSVVNSVDQETQIADETSPQIQGLISKPNLCRAMDMTRSGIDKLLKNDPSFPRPLKFGDSQQATCYFAVAEFNAWLEARLAERGSA